MQGAPRLPLGVVTIVLLVAPGLIGLELYYWASKKRRREFSRTLLLVYSVAYSLVSLIIVYSLSPRYFDELVRLSNNILNSYNLAEESAITGLPIVGKAILYGLYALTAATVGTFVGWVVRFVLYRGENQNPRDSWRYAFETVVEDRENVVVKLKNGRTIAGTFVREAWDEREHDLYLKNPRVISTSIDDDTDGVNLRMETLDEVDRVGQIGQSTVSGGDSAVNDRVIDHFSNAMLLTDDSVASVRLFDPVLDGTIASQDIDDESGTPRDRSRRKRIRSGVTRIYSRMNQVTLQGVVVALWNTIASLLSDEVSHKDKIDQDDIDDLTGDTTDDEGNDN